MRTKFYDSDGDCVPSSRMTWLDLLIVAVTFTVNTLEETTNALTGVLSLLQQHYNYDVDREDFHSQVAQNIEKIAGGEHG